MEANSRAEMDRNANLLSEVMGTVGYTDGPALPCPVLFSPFSFYFPKWTEDCTWEAGNSSVVEEQAMPAICASISFKVSFLQPNVSI